MNNSNDKKLNKLDKNMVTFYFGCNKNRNNLTIKMKTKTYEDYNEFDLHKLTLKTDLITGIKVGPKTIVQIFSDPYHYRLRDRFINETDDKTKQWEAGCFQDHGLWTGIIRSFRIWDYDYYDSVHGLRYCDADNECRDYELCLCPGGQKKAEWCPVRKRRCLHKGNLLHNKERILNVDDLVNMDCLCKEMMKYKKKYNNNITSFRNIKHMAETCSTNDKIDMYQKDYSLNYYYHPQADQPSLKHQYHLIETFDANKNSKTYIIYILFIFLIFLIFYIK